MTPADPAREGLSMVSDYMNQRKVRSFSDIEELCHRNDTIVTLCGGGLDSAYLLAQLSKLDVHLVALSVDVGDDFDIEQFLMHRRTSLM